jgi:hypothetical protein
MSNWCDNCEIAEPGDVCTVCGADLTPAATGPMPWRWRFFIVATVVYLGYRVYQLISWISH